MAKSKKEPKVNPVSMPEDSYMVDDGVSAARRYADLKSKPVLHRKVMKRMMDHGRFAEGEIKPRKGSRKTGR